MPPGSPNPDPISDQKMSFSHPFSDLASKKLYISSLLRLEQEKNAEEG